MTKPPDARTVNPGQPVTYHESAPVKHDGAALVGARRDDLAARILEVLRSPEGRAAIADVISNPPTRMSDGSYREQPSSVFAEVFPGLTPHAFVVGDPRHDSCAVCGKGSRNSVHVCLAVP